MIWEQQNGREGQRHRFVIHDSTGSLIWAKKRRRESGGLSIRLQTKKSCTTDLRIRSGIPHIPMPSAARLSRGKTPRDSQLCVPASQQVCLYRCNRTEKI